MSASTSENASKRLRKSPEDIVRALMNALNSDPKFTEKLADDINSGWETAWKYLNLIEWIQSCPKLISQNIGRKWTWKREWGRLPE